MVLIFYLLTDRVVAVVVAVVGGRVSAAVRLIRQLIPRWILLLVSGRDCSRLLMDSRREE